MSPSGSGTDRPPRLAVLDYGIGNLRSAQKALEHVGADATLTADPAVIEAADAVVLPGVGAFGRCRAGAGRHRTRPGRPRRDRHPVDRSWASASACSCSTTAPRSRPGVDGLGVLPRRGAPPARRREAPADAVEPTRRRVGRRRCSTGSASGRGCTSCTPSLPRRPTTSSRRSTTAARSPLPRSAASVMATQFHPEKSGRGGLAVLRNFVELAAAPTPIPRSR